jgi:excinuclease ABC subunit C
MVRRAKYAFSIRDDVPLYPHIKLTRERFPRPLATRLIGSDNAEYYGAFLNRTNTRLLLDMMTRVFRLRACDIPIDGSFSVPCTQYFRRRCLAPCVASLCSEEKYAEMAAIVRLFLSGERQAFESAVRAKMETEAEALDFESAALWRDILTEAEFMFTTEKRYPWLDRTVDTFDMRLNDGLLDIFLVSHRGRRAIGERVFTFEGVAEPDAKIALADVISQFYKFHAPREIRVPVLPDNSREIEGDLKDRFGRRVPIVRYTAGTATITAGRALWRASRDLEIQRLAEPASPAEIAREIKQMFGLRKAPKRITAIDAAHISGTLQTAAAIAWEDGRSVPEAARYVYSDGNEFDAVSDLVSLIFAETSSLPQLLLIDGGSGYLNAAMGALPDGQVAAVGAVKPRTQHSEISHFLTSEGSRVEFDITSPAHRLLKRLRDDAHEFANAVHRDTRDFAAFYPEGRPLIVPLRLQDENGAAEDLRPIEARGKRR